MKLNINVETIVLICILLIILYGHLLFSCAKTHNPYLLIEGFKETMKKTADAIKVTPSNEKRNGITKEAFSNHKQSYSEGNNSSMLMFANTPFKPECCPTTYTNSMGCACISNKQYQNLIHRGGNNVPYSEY